MSSRVIHGYKKEFFEVKVHRIPDCSARQHAALTALPQQALLASLSPLYLPADFQEISCPTGN
jgi:hypothetical protein